MLDSGARNPYSIRRVSCDCRTAPWRREGMTIGAFEHANYRVALIGGIVVGLMSIPMMRLLVGIPMGIIANRAPRVW